MAPLYILSWDCANKTLAWSYMRIDLDLYVDVKTRLIECTTCNDPDTFRDTILSCNRDLDHVITYISKGVVDLLPGKKLCEVNDVQRTSLLAKWIAASPVAIDKLDPSTSVIIEAQPPRIGVMQNRSASAVQYQLMFYYVNFNTLLLSPKLKNNTCDALYGKPVIEPGKKTASKAYRDRKKQTVETVTKLAALFNWENPFANLLAKSHDDLADSTMQALTAIQSIRVQQCNE